MNAHQPTMLAEFLAEQNRYHSNSMAAQDPIMKAHIARLVEWERWVRASGDVRAAVIEECAKEAEKAGCGDANCMGCLGNQIASMIRDLAAGRVA